MKHIKKIMLVIILFQSCSFFNNDNGQILFTAANSEKGFEFPYFLFIPDSCSIDTEITLVVEPNNSGFVSDDFEEHIENARNVAENSFYIGNYIARKLKIPLLVPVFPRAESTWKIYTHALDRDVILQKGTNLERIDLQLIAMVNDAQSKLEGMGHTVGEKFFMTGFSASGTFTNRFTLIHPEKVLAAAAGGVNGLLILPKKGMNSKALNYPLGTNDFDELFGKTFDLEIFRATPQFYFMGELDENDAIPYDDAFDDDERNIIYEILGEEMLPARWNKCIFIYQEERINSLIKTYNNIGHEHSSEIHEEILDFFNLALMNRLN